MNKENSMNNRAQSNSYFWGILLILLGILFLLQNFGYLDIGNLLSIYWPLLLVVFGLKIIINRREASGFKQRKFSEEMDFATKGEEISAGKGESKVRGVASETMVDSSFLGDIRLKFDDHNITHYAASNFLGDIELDFSKAIFTDKSHLKVSGGIVDINIKLPENLSVEIQSNYTVGSSKLFEKNESGFFKKAQYHSPKSAAKNPRLRIFTTNFIGDVRIQN
jgi:predicted membrane protein